MELERERSQAKPRTERRADLDSRKREIEQVISDTRKTPGSSTTIDAESRENACDDVVSDVSAGR